MRNAIVRALAVLLGSCCFILALAGVAQAKAELEIEIRNDLDHWVFYNATNTSDATATGQIGNATRWGTSEIAARSTVSGHYSSKTGPGLGSNTRIQFYLSTFGLDYVGNEFYLQVNWDPWAGREESQDFDPDVGIKSNEDTLYGRNYCFKKEIQSRSSTDKTIILTLRPTEPPPCG